MLAAHLSREARGESHCGNEVVTSLAASDVTVLINGETGSGKGVLAREIHERSAHSKGPFVVADCSALTPSLLESQMFGHVKGAFTGATSSRLGLVRAANGGTLFLDEVGELSLELQAKLLTLLEDRTVLPVGSEEREDVQVRFIAATHRDLQAMVRTGEFREDLYFRLAVVELEVSPLRARREDIPKFVGELIERKADLLHVPAKQPSEEFMKALLVYDWPGNIRELGNCIERALVLSTGDALDVGSLPPRMLDVLQSCPESIATGTDAGTRRSRLVRAIHAAGGNKSEAARRLGISRRHLYRLLNASQGA